MTQTYDIAIVGSGFAGSLLAMIAVKLGRSVILLERGTHPRVVIGESSTPLSNLLFEELATRYNLPALLPFTKWGSWQRDHPELACGLKRGFSFFHHQLGNNSGLRPDREMLVAASPHNAIADTHWYRADFDHWLLREAQRMGVAYHDQVSLHSFSNQGEHVELAGNQDEQEVTFQAKFVIDATGPRGCLHHLLGLSEAPLPSMPATQALYSHFRNVRRLESNNKNNNSDTPPYPMDDAAVHHIFDGGWIWVLRFNNGITSAGVAATKATADRLGFVEGAPAWKRVLNELPVLLEQFGDAIPQQPFTYLPRLTFRSATIAGTHWAQLPSAAGFVDPLLSSGFPLTLLGISRMAEILDKHWNQASFARELQTYAALTDDELLVTSQLIGALYATMSNFKAFRAVSLLYFAAASYAETARRLGRPERAESFLLHTDPQFGPAANTLFQRAACGVSEEETRIFIQDVYRVIEPFDVAGLRSSPRNSWYPVNAGDLRQAAAKTGASLKEIDVMLQRSGFYAE